MNMQKAEETYRHDPQYFALVNVLVAQIETLKMSSSEIRAAAMYACIIIERRQKPLPRI